MNDWLTVVDISLLVRGNNFIASRTRAPLNPSRSCDTFVVT
jgi:hypothetical protein